MLRRESRCCKELSLGAAEAEMEGSQREERTGMIPSRRKVKGGAQADSRSFADKGCSVMRLHYNVIFERVSDLTRDFSIS